jgi:hypothetical protein
VTVFVVLAGICGSSLADLEWLTATALMVGLTIGLVWLIAFMIAANDTRMHYSRRVWARWVGVPAVCFASLALMWSGTPAVARFEWSRPALEQAAANAQAGTTYGSGWIGLEYVHDVRVDGKTTVFVESGDALSGECGLAYSADQSVVPAWVSHNDDWTSLGHGWWHWCTYNYND